MFEFLWIAGTGWFAIIFLVLASMLPFGLRWIRSGNAMQLGGMRTHYFFGFAIPALAAAHSFSTMSRMQGSNPGGIWLATFALAALFIQMTLGIELRKPPWGQPHSLRRWHLSVMIAAAGLIAAHVALNRV